MIQHTKTDLHDTLLHDDDLVAVVRGHLYIESQLNKLIEALLPFPKEISSSRLGWQQRVELALALSLKKQHGAPLKKLGSIRNKFAHQPDASLNKNDVSLLYQSLHKEDKEIVMQAFDMTQKQVDDPFEGTFDDLSVKEQFALIVVTLHSMLEVANHEVTGDPIYT